MARNEVEQFVEIWDQEAKKTVELMRALPRDKYDFRPDPQGRSLGELAWHLSEGDAFISFGIEKGVFSPEQRPAGIERPRKVEELAPGYERVHRDARARVLKLKPADLDRTMEFFSMPAAPIRQLLWEILLHHKIHHRGQLVLMCRLAGGRPTRCYGPTLEELPLPSAKS